MRIVFDKIVTNDSTLRISLDDGNTYFRRPVSELLENGHTFNELECKDLADIRVGNYSVQRPSYTFELNDYFKKIERWYAKTSAQLKGYLEGLPENTPENPYLIRLSDLNNNWFDPWSNSSTLPSKRYYRIKLIGSITDIPADAFKGCRGLLDINIGTAVTSIGENAFKDCSSLTEFNLPDSVRSIGANAFELCTSLKSLNYNGTMFNLIDTVDFGANWNKDVASDFNINAGESKISFDLGYFFDEEVKIASTGNYKTGAAVAHFNVHNIAFTGIDSPIQLRYSTMSAQSTSGTNTISEGINSNNQKTFDVWCGFSSYSDASKKPSSVYCSVWVYSNKHNGYVQLNTFNVTSGSYGYVRKTLNFGDF